MDGGFYMFTLQSALDIIITIINLLAYVLITTPAGAFRAWVAKKMGDPTAQQLGLTSLNPLLHVDIIGIACMAFFGFGWGRKIPLNPNNLTGKFQTIRIIVATLSGISIYLLQAFICIVGSTLLLGSKFLTVLAMFFDSELRVMLDVSSLFLIVGLIFAICIRLSIFLFVIELVFNGILLTVILVSKKRYYEFHHSLYMILIVPLIILWFFGQPLQELLTEKIYEMAMFMSQLMGIT